MGVRCKHILQRNQWAVPVALASTFLLECASVAAAGTIGASLELIRGKKSLDSYWEPTDSQSEWGTVFSIYPTESRFGLEMGFLVAASDEANFDSSLSGMTETSEMYFGVKKVIDANDQLKLFIHGGLAVVSMDVTLSTPFNRVSDNASGSGYYWGTGGYYMVSKNVGLGMAARVTSADVDFGGGDLAAGGTHLAATIGFFLD